MIDFDIRFWQIWEKAGLKVPDDVNIIYAEPPAIVPTTLGDLSHNPFTGEKRDQNADD